MDSLPVISFLKVTKRFKRDFWSKEFCALDDVSFDIPAGEVSGFLGANGAGKTTSLKIALGFITSDQGRVEFPLFKGDKNGQEKRRIGYLPERPYFYPDLTGREFLTYMAKLNDVSNDSIAHRINTWAQRLQIEFALERKVRSYSKGMLQRLGFCAALLHEPELLILDEPMSGLDPVGREEFKEIIKELKHLNKTIFFSSHIVSDIEEICRSIVFLDKGQVAYQGTVRDLISKHTDGLINIEYGGSRAIQFENQDAVLLSEGRFQLKVEGSRKSQVLELINREGFELIKLAPDIQTLEKILYRIRK